MRPRLSRDFVRGAVASGLLAAADPHAARHAARQALLGGLALMAGGAVEQLIFDRKENAMSKKKRDKRAKRTERLAGLDAAGLEALLGRRPRRGIAALRPTEQFLLGAAIGAGALYLLGDEQLRGRLMRAGMQLYGNLAGGLEEMKEQMADIRAEMAAESAGA